MAVSLLIAVLLCAPRLRSQQALSEYQVKAAFLFNFGKFVQWPDGSFAGPEAPFQVCVLGEDPFGPALDDTLRGKTIANHAVVVARIKDVSGARRCHVLFVSSSEQPRLAAIFAAERMSKTLVVGETEGFAASGGAIQFTLEEKHVRFAINPDAIQRSGLQVSSRLLALANIVHDGARAGKE